MSDSPQSPLLDYHQRTKHRFEAYAEGPGQLDWDAQPAPFRHYLGAPRTILPLSAAAFERPFGELDRPPARSATLDLDGIGALFELSLAISAWKSWGPNRWALRCNPSSGNLHPVEAYLLCSGVNGLADGVHHYDPLDHALEGRALLATAPPATPWLAIGLSTVMWREAWKYGERAFRYCQLDVGHALAAVAYAARLLGWQARPLALPADTLGRVLGCTRTADFAPARHAYTEAEEAEALLFLHAPSGAATAPALAQWLATAQWHGSPSAIDPAPGYRWPIVGTAAGASRCRGATLATPPQWPPLPPVRPAPAAGAVQVIRQRRSAQRFDPARSLPQEAFYRLLDATLPRPCAPFDAQASAPAIALLLFVLRVEGLPSGLYLLPRGTTAASLIGATRFPARRPLAADSGCPPHLALEVLAELPLQAVQRLARSLSCHQDIAATSAFSLGMLADLGGVDSDGHLYRERLREAGLIGHALYLEAEAAGMRGTGIGCFFDDPVHDSFGIDDPRWQSVYHFTVGAALDDARITTAPAYPQRQRELP